MYKFIQIHKFTKVLFASEKTARKASKIIEGVLKAELTRIKDITDTITMELLMP